MTTLYFLTSLFIFMPLLAVMSRPLPTIIIALASLGRLISHSICTVLHHFCGKEANQSTYLLLCFMSIKLKSLSKACEKWKQMENNCFTSTEHTDKKAIHLLSQASSSSRLIYMIHMWTSNSVFVHHPLSVCFFFI